MERDDHSFCLQQCCLARDKICRYRKSYRLRSKKGITTLVVYNLNRAEQLLLLIFRKLPKDNDSSDFPEEKHARS